MGLSVAAFGKGQFSECNAATDGGLMQSVDHSRSSLKQGPTRSSQLNFAARELLMELQVEPDFMADFSSHRFKTTALFLVTND